MISNLLAPGAAGWAVTLNAGFKLKGGFNRATAKTRSRRPSGDERRRKEREGISTVSYTHLTLPTTGSLCRSRGSPYH